MVARMHKTFTFIILSSLLTLFACGCMSSSGGSDITGLTDAQLDAAFEQAVREFEQATGQTLDASVWENPEQFALLMGYVKSYLPLTDIPEEHGEDTAYCGPGSGQQNESFFPGSCLNAVCQTHDECYGQIEADYDCYWSARTGSCDDPWFSGHTQCLPSSLTNSNFWAMLAITRGLQRLPREGCSP